MVNTFSPLAIISSPDRDYRYKSVATQIPHNAGLAPYYGYRSTSLKHGVANLWDRMHYD